MFLENHNGEVSKVNGKVKRITIFKIRCLFLRVLPCRAGLPQIYNPLASAPHSNYRELLFHLVLI